MTNDTSPPTKGDIKELRGELATLSTKVDSLAADLRTEMRADKEELKRHFDVVAETLRHDLLGIHRDKIENVADKQNNHEKRIVRLEKFNGLVTYRE